jgi:hypothetical protein
VKRLLFGLCLLLSVPVGAAPEKPAPALLQLINEGRPDEQNVTSDQVRVIQPESFPEATLVGFMAGSNECLLGRVIIEGKSLTPGEAAGVLLRKRGWESADATEKSRLAMLWVQDGLLAFGEKIVTKKPEGFGDKDVKFREPEVQCALSGAVRVLVWVEEPLGPSSGRQYRRNLYWFSKEGAVVRARVTERFELLGDV